MNFDTQLLKNTVLKGDAISSNLSSLIPIYSVNEEDAKLILDLRTQKEGNFLKQGAETLSQQLKYLEKYLKRFQNQEEIYYKIFDKKNSAYAGVVRLTQLKHEFAMNWESLVVFKTCTPLLPIDVMIMVYDICFKVFGVDKCGPWEVKRNHKNMMKIHDYCAMYRIEETNSDSYWISVAKEDYDSQISRFKKLGLGLSI